MTRLHLDQLQPIVAFCDPAGRPKSREQLKRVRARTALVVVGMDHLLRKYVLVADAGRWPATETVERMFTLTEQYKISSFGVEANAMQELYAQMIADKARTAGRYLPLREIHQPTNIEKLWRIRTILQPVLARGELVIDPAHQHELKVELQSFPTGRTVDLVDALASAIAMLPRRTAVASTADERQKLQDYLTRLHVAPDLIEARLARFDSEAAARRPPRTEAA